MRVLLFVGDIHVGTIHFEWLEPSSWVVDVDTIEWDVQDNYLQERLQETFDNNLLGLIIIGGQRPDDIRPYFEVWEQAIAELSRELSLGLRAILPERLPELQLREEHY
jgi:hypothetical protein